MDSFLKHIDDGSFKFCNDAGYLHKDVGPAFIGVDGTFIWVQNGRYHRSKGPAVLHANGDKEWWINGVKQLNAERKYFDKYETETSKKFIWIKKRK